MLRSLDLKSGVLVKTTAFVLGMGAACLIGFVRPGFLFANSKIAVEQSVKQQSVKQSPERVVSDRIDASRATEAPPEGPLDRFMRNLHIASSTGAESDKQYLANQLDLFSIKATPRFRAEVLTADKDLKETARLGQNSLVLARSSARFLAVSAADYVVGRDYSEARRLLTISERLHPGLDVQRTVRAALLKVNAKSEDLLFRDLPQSVQSESLVERILSFVLGVILLTIVALAAVFGYVFYSRISAFGPASIGSKGMDSQDDSGYIGKIRKLVVVPGRAGSGFDTSASSKTPPEDEPTPPEMESSLKLRRAA